MPFCVNALPDDATDWSAAYRMPCTITSHDEVFTRRVAIGAI
jgi:hypothetical protein